MPVPMLKRLTLSNFKSIESAVIEFENPTYLVGQNGSGKSNITGAIALLAEAMTSPLHAVFTRRGGVSSVRHRRPGPGRPLNFGLYAELAWPNPEIETAQYSFDIRAAPSQGFEIAKEECTIIPAVGPPIMFQRTADAKFECSPGVLNPLLDSQSLALPIMGGDERFKPISDFFGRMRVYKPDPIALAVPQNPADEAQLQPNGANIATVLTTLGSDPAAREAVNGLLAAAVPGMHGVRSTQIGTKLSLEFRQGRAPGHSLDLSAHEVSDGTLRLLALLVAAYQPMRASVVVFEEPEATIHPGAMGVLFDAFDHAARSSQVIVTTHSPEVLEQKQINDQHLKLIRWQDGRTLVDAVPAGTAHLLRDRLTNAGELLRANALHFQDVIDGDEIDRYIRTVAETAG